MQRAARRAIGPCESSAVPRDSSGAQDPGRWPTRPDEFPEAVASVPLLLRRDFLRAPRALARLAEPDRPVARFSRTWRTRRKNRHEAFRNSPPARTFAPACISPRPAAPRRAKRWAHVHG